MEDELHICLIPGLGAGPEVFDRLNTGQIPRTCISWIPPHRNESLASYAQRLCTQLPENRRLILIGVSFGGMVALEMQHHLKVSHTFLVSTAAHPSELRRVFRIAGALRLDRLLPVDWLLRLNPFLFLLFGIRTKSDKALLNQMLKYTDARFIRWAMRSVLEWRPVPMAGTTTRIHGTRDRLLLCPATDDVIGIPEAGHLMVRTHARQVSKIICELLEKHV